jgi:hypothetical protein
MKKQTPVFQFIVLALLLSGFTLRPPAPKAQDYSMASRMTTTVKSDGSGNVEVDILISKDLVDILNNQSSNIDCDSLSSQTKFDLSDQSQGGDLHCVGSLAFKDLDELTNITERELNGSVDRIEIKDRHFYYDVTTGGGFYSTSSQIKIEAYWILVLPGTPGDNNADTVSGRTLTWDLSNTTKASHLTAECALGGGFLGMDTTTMMIAAAVLLSCCCIILLIAAVVVFILMRRKKKPAAEIPAPAP